MSFDQLLSLLSVLGASTLINFFVQRHFSKKDEEMREHIKKKSEEQLQKEIERKKMEEKRQQDFAVLKDNVNLGLETIRLLSYARVAEEADRLIKQGYATPNDRAYLKYLYDNYKKWKWNGDMEERMHKVHSLPPYPID